MSGFDREARERTIEAVAVWLPEYVEALQQHTDLPLEALEQIERATRWAIEATEGDAELWRYKRCQTCKSISSFARCVEGDRKLVWPGEETHERDD